MAETVRFRGVLAWFAGNAVAANVILLVLLVGGVLAIGNLQQEVFPDIELDVVMAEIRYPGASPQEVEQGVLLVTEEEVEGIDGVRAVESIADEGLGIVLVEVLDGASPDRVLRDVENAVAGIGTYPEDAERPIISLLALRNLVVSVAIFGPDDEEVLRRFAEVARDMLLRDDRVTLVELAATRPREISIEIPGHEMRRLGLTLSQIASRIRAGAVELPGGELDTAAEDIMVRTAHRLERGEEFGQVVVLAAPSGASVRVDQIARRIVDGFADTGQRASFNGQRAVMLNAFRVGDQTPQEVSDATQEVVELLNGEVLPPGIGALVWQDSAVMFRDRINLLLRNGSIGLLLILLILGLFLELKLAFWVMVGLAVSFIGAILFMPTLDVSINMVSLFAFIVALGLVIDDAIIVGEAVFNYRQEGMKPLAAAVAGVQEMVLPVTFAVLTTAIAFAPMLFVSGFAGRIYRNIPLIVLPVLAISLVEALLILPSHLAHIKTDEGRGVWGWIGRRQRWIGSKLDRFVEQVYMPMVAVAVKLRYLTMAIFVAVLLVSVAMVLGGRLEFIFMPRVEGDTAAVLLEFPFGTPAAHTGRALEDLENGARIVMEEFGPGEYFRGVLTQQGERLVSMAGPAALGARPQVGAHLGEVAVDMVPAGDRPFSSEAFVRRWRQVVGEVPGAIRLAFYYEVAGAGQVPIAFDLHHPDPLVAEEAALELAAIMEEYVGVHDVDAGLARGKTQIDLQLTALGRHLGLTPSALAEQVRSSIWGAEVLQQQRDRHEVSVYVRLPAEERRSERAMRRIPVLTPDGAELPLYQVAHMSYRESPARLRRREGRRMLQVSADVDPLEANAGQIGSRIEAVDLPSLQERWPDLEYRLAGQQEAQEESTADLLNLFILALVVMYGVLAIALGSFLQPLIILSSIPFGIIGAVLGHLLMGLELSLISLMGVVALSGVVVNDSLLLLTTTNRMRQEGVTMREAVVNSGARRFRPVLLTTLTTFFGLAPLIVERSVQAQFLVPMAVSLGFGIVFATVITLVFVPAFYRVLDDLVRLWKGES